MYTGVLKIKDLITKNISTLTTIIKIMKKSFFCKIFCWTSSKSVIMKAHQKSFETTAGKVNSW